MHSITEVVYRPGKQNAVAETTPRRPDFVGAVTRGQERKDQTSEGPGRDRDEQCRACDDFLEVWERCRHGGDRDKDQEGCDLVTLFAHRRGSSGALTLSRD